MSQISKTITKEEINELPQIKFEGKMVLIEDHEKLDEALEEIYSADVVGFDTETKPSFKKGQINKLALLQIALPDKTFLVRVNGNGLLGKFKKFLTDPGVLKIGVALDDDFLQIKRQLHFEPDNFIDLNKLAPELGFEKIGVRNLSALFLNGRVSKNQQTSNWENEKLTYAQKVYAATDAWVCLKIYEKMKEIKLI